MIKVLQIGMSYETGGTEVFLYNHYKEINREEIQFDFIAYKDTMSFEEEVTKLGAKVHKVVGPRKNPIKSGRTSTTLRQGFAKNKSASVIYENALFDLFVIFSFLFCFVPCF